MNKSSVDLSNHNNTPHLLSELTRPIIIADDIRTPQNMGMILRIAANIGASMTYFISETADSFKKHKINRTSSGASDKTNWKIVKSADKITGIPDDMIFTAIETCSDATNIWNTQLPAKAVLVVGNEVTGISDIMLAKCSQKVYIPVPGVISSLNVTHALAVASFEWLRQATK